MPSAPSDTPSLQLDLRVGTRRVFVVALLIRVIFGVMVTPFSPDDVRWEQFYWSSDGYVAIAETLVDHGKYAFGLEAPPNAYRAPLFPLLIAGVYAVVGNLGVAVLVVNAFAAALTCALLFRFVARSFGDDLPQRLAAWAPVIFPMSVFYMGKSFSDSLVALTVVGAALASVRLVERADWRDGLWSGVWFGLGVLTKSVLLPLLGLLTVYVLLLRRRATGPALLCGAITVGIVAPWCVRSVSQVGTIGLSAGGGFNLLFGTHIAMASGTSQDVTKRGFQTMSAVYEAAYGVPLTTADVRPNHFWEVAPATDRRCADLAWQEFRAEPLRLPKKLAINAARFWYLSTTHTRSIIAMMMHIPILLLGTVALARWLRTAPALRGWLVVFLVGYVAVYLFVNVATVRYSLPVLLLLVPFAGATVERGLLRQPSAAISDLVN